MHEEILSLAEPEEIGAEVINHMKSLEPTYQVLAQAKLKLEQFKHSEYGNTASLPLGSSIERFRFDFLYHYRYLFPIFKQFDWFIW